MNNQYQHTGHEVTNHEPVPAKTPLPEDNLALWLNDRLHEIEKKIEAIDTKLNAMAERGY